MSSHLTVVSESIVEIFNFVVVSPEARQVYVVGDFNRWQTLATPMQETEPHVWQLSIRLPRGKHRFSYCVIDQWAQASQAPFGDTYLLPGTWAAVVRGEDQPALHA